MKRYLSVIPLAEALALIAAEFPFALRSESVPLASAAGKVTASPIYARFSVPEIHISAMDGIAVRSADTAGASEQRPVTLPDAARVNTGNVVPPGYDAVIMIEDVWEDGGRFTIRKAASPWQHVRPAGEDIAESEMALPSLHRIRPHEIGALAAYGITAVEAVSVRIGLIPTGSELVPHGSRPGPGQVVESNTMMAAAWLSAAGASCRTYPITPDEPDRIRDVIGTAVAENDIVVVSAGSSAGTRDYTAGVIGDLGTVLVHGVAIRPGKPVIIGKISGKPVIGLPGYPLSALTVLREVIGPLLARFGIAVPESETIKARLTATIASDAGTDEFVLLSAGKIKDRYVASPLSRGSGVQMAAVRANAYLQVPAAVEGFEAGTDVPVRLMGPGSRVDAALLLTGSHDPCLDILADLLQFGGVEAHSAHVGSMGGLLALKKDECHAAPMHLLSDDGTYNTGYLDRYLPDVPLVLIAVADREQGIVSRDGTGLDGIAGRQFINRQRGSGTRILLDYELGKRSIDPKSIPGYDREATTHLGVALAVKTGEADAGMCVYSAAKALGLQFVPVAAERYELAIRRSHLADRRVQALIEAVKSERFRTELLRLGGYGLSATGKIRELH